MRIARTLTVALCCLHAVAETGRLGAQARRITVDSSHYEVTFGLTMSETGYVNRKPTCTNIGLPCETSGREFPDFGFILEGALHETSAVAVVTEASVYFNYWDTTHVAGTTGQRINYVRALLAGSRLTSQALYPFTGESDPLFVYAQLLAGPEASTVAPVRFALQPGIGVYSPVSLRSCCGRSTKARFRLAWDYRWTHGQPRNLSGGRVVFAVAFAD